MSWTYWMQASKLPCTCAIAAGHRDSAGLREGLGSSCALVVWVL